jgi:hypothetical protein
MRTDIGGLVVIALLGVAAFLLFTSVDPRSTATTFGCMLTPDCTYHWRDRFWPALFALLAAAWLIWRLRRRAPK